MAAGDVSDKRRASMSGFTVFTCKVVTNGTTQVTVETALKRVMHVQLTWAELPANGTDAVLYVNSISGGVVGIKSSSASGLKEAYVLVMGYA